MCGYYLKSGFYNQLWLGNTVRIIGGVIMTGGAIQLLGQFLKRIYNVFTVKFYFQLDTYIRHYFYGRAWIIASLITPLQLENLYLMCVWFLQLVAYNFLVVWRSCITTSRGLFVTIHLIIMLLMSSVTCWITPGQPARQGMHNLDEDQVSFIVCYTFIILWIWPDRY